MTVKQFLSTGIFDCLFKLKKTKANRLYWLGCAHRIVNAFNLLDQDKPTSFPNKQYIKNLKSDLKKLQRIKTHTSQIQSVKCLVEIEYRIGKKYIESFNNNWRKEFKMDFFLLTAYTELIYVGYEERMQILANLFSLARTPIINYASWKAKHIHTANSRTSAVKKRLKRTVTYLCRWGQTKTILPGFKKSILDWALAIDNDKKRTKDFPRFFEQSAKNTYLISCLKLLARKQCASFAGINNSLILDILIDLKIPEAKKTHKYILQDTEFLSALQGNP